jgi:large subunit ribosomal protein L24
MSQKKKQTKLRPQKMHVKKGDTVQVIAGSDKGKVGEILRSIPQESTVVVKGVNIRTKHVKPQQEGESGQIVTYEAPIHSSKVMLYSTKQKIASRIAYTVTEAGKKVRMLKKTGEIID